MKKSIIVFTLLIFILSGFTYPNKRKTLAERILDKLVQKGILTKKEAEVMLKESKKEMSEEKEDKNVEVKKIDKEEIKNLVKEELPNWVGKIKFKGDLRIRYEYLNGDNLVERNRGRYRFRFGLETKINSRLKVFAGIATGGADARSTNQTMTNGFETPDVRLNYAYGKWNINRYLTFKAGKINPIKKVLFRPSDLIWDSDLNPEGISISFKKGAFFTNGGFFILDEIKNSTDDPYMFLIQPGVNLKFSENTNLKIGVAGYFFNNVKGSVLFNGADSSGEYNTLENGVLKYDYDSISPGFELGLKDPFNSLPYLALFGDYIYNPDPDNNNQGYLCGFKFGDKKVKFKGNWQFKYMYRRLEKDAWLDIFPDSDAYSGHTDIKGHEFVFEYGVSDFTNIVVDYYYLRRITVENSTRHLLQIDWNIKF